MGSTCCGFASHLTRVLAAEGNVITVTLTKTAGGLGFSLEGGQGSLQGDRPLTINRIFQGRCSGFPLAFRPGGMDPFLTFLESSVLCSDCIGGG